MPVHQLDIGLDLPQCMLWIADRSAPVPGAAEANLVTKHNDMTCLRSLLETGYARKARCNVLTTPFRLYRPVLLRRSVHASHEEKARAANCDIRWHPVAQ